MGNTTKRDAAAAVREVAKLKEQGFDASHYAPATGRITVDCSECMIFHTVAGPMHQSGCPNNKMPMIGP